MELQSGSKITFYSFHFLGKIIRLEEFQQPKKVVNMGNLILNAIMLLTVTLQQMIIIQSKFSER